MSKSVENIFDTFDDFCRFLTWPLSAGPFCNPLIPNPWFTELPPPNSPKPFFFHGKVLRRIPFPEIGSEKDPPVSEQCAQGTTEIHWPVDLGASSRVRHALIGLFSMFSSSYFACCPENSCGFSLRSCLGILQVKNGGDFWWIFSGLRFPRNEARKVLKKFGENSEQNSGQKFGTRIRKIRGVFVLQLFWPRSSSKKSHDVSNSKQCIVAWSSWHLSSSIGRGFNAKGSIEPCLWFWSPSH